MNSTDSLSTPPPSDAAEPLYNTTRWSQVLRAGSAAAPGHTAALNELCRERWLPLYHVARRWGLPVEDAQDAVQDFFSRVLLRQTLSQVSPGRGSFRAFLFTAFCNHLKDGLRKGKAQKRGAGLAPISLDQVNAEGERTVPEPEDTHTPEQAYEQAWRICLVNEAIHQVRAAYEARGRGAIFTVLEPHLLMEGAESLKMLAARLGLTEVNVRTQLHRLREALREAIREAIFQTVSDEASFDGELAHFARLVEAKPEPL